MTSPFKPAYLSLPLAGGRGPIQARDTKAATRELQTAASEKDSKIFFSEEKKQKTFIFLCGTT